MGFLLALFIHLLIIVGLIALKWVNKGCLAKKPLFYFNSWYTNKLAK